MPANPPVILVVDDEPNIQHILKLRLELNGQYRVIVSESSEAAVTLAQTERPDLILLDVLMPGLSGYEVWHRLKAQETTKRIPIIFVTVKNPQQDEELQRLLTQGTGYLTKPFETDDLLRLIATTLADARRRPA